jgi:hypothetical protein
MRSIASTATPQIPATWAAVMPYFAQARMLANCELGISGEQAMSDGSSNLCSAQESLLLA